MAKQKPASKKSTPARKAARKRPPSQAERADRHDLYELSVQSPDADCALFEGIFVEQRQRKPMVLREDFCGTAKLSRTWCLGGRGRKAIGIDFDGPTLAQARVRNVEPYAKQLGGRLELIEADVLEIEPGRIADADLIAALNFSFCVFKQRAVLARYLANTLGGLGDDGVLILEMFGGLTATDTCEEEREIDGGADEDFTYEWEQASFNPLTNEILCHIHFSFEDGSRIDKAFTYDWRLWSIPELRDLLLEVGYAEVKIYWQRMEEDEDEEDMLSGSGEYDVQEVVEQQDSWLVYVVALK